MHNKPEFECKYCAPKSNQFCLLMLTSRLFIRLLQLLRATVTRNDSRAAVMAVDDGVIGGITLLAFTSNCDRNADCVKRVRID